MSEQEDSVIASTPLYHPLYLHKQVVTATPLYYPLCLNM